MDGDSFDVTCPTCFEVFPVPPPPPDEVPGSFDYDCQVCCSPMVIHCAWEGGRVVGFALGMDEAIW
jgi:hypothetical protein